MNPVLILVAILVLSQGKTGGFPVGPKPPGHISSPKIARLSIPPVKVPPYFDTFKMDLLLDRMHSMTDTLEKVNHLNQMRNIPLDKSNSIDRIQESLDAVKGLLYQNKTNKKLDNISNTLSGVKKFGDMENIMTNIGPFLSAFSNQNDK
jgi:hypothetical protein